jgi:hypothetical protein
MSLRKPFPSSWQFQAPNHGRQPNAKKAPFQHVPFYRHPTRMMIIIVFHKSRESESRLCLLLWSLPTAYGSAFEPATMFHIIAMRCRRVVDEQSQDDISTFVKEKKNATLICLSSLPTDWRCGKPCDDTSKLKDKFAVGPLSPMGPDCIRHVKFQGPVDAGGQRYGVAAVHVDVVHQGPMTLPMESPSLSASPLGGEFSSSAPATAPPFRPLTVSQPPRSLEASR